MADLTFETEVSWSGTGKNGEGKITMSEETVPCSGPANMGGKGVGVSPEDLLIGAVSTCYIGTFFAILSLKKLPVERITVKSEGVVTDYPSDKKFSRLIVNPTIIGGDQSKQSDYEKAATKARDKCFIGQSIKGNIDYEVGIVQIEDGQ